jgi:hypothetical protein
MIIWEFTSGLAHLTMQSKRVYRSTIVKKKYGSGHCIRTCAIPVIPFHCHTPFLNPGFPISVNV